MSLLTDHIHFNRIIFRDRIFTGNYLQKAVDDFALFLDQNIRSNSRIVYLFAPNHIKTVIAFLGIIKTGRAALLVDPKVGKLEYEEMLADTKPSAIVKIDPETVEFDFRKEIELTDNKMDMSEISQLDEVCTLRYTAGHDGYMKATMLTHHNIFSTAKAICNCGVGENDITIALCPFCHLYSLQTGILAPGISHGTALIEEIELSKIRNIISSINKHKATHIYSVPAIYFIMCKHPDLQSFLKNVKHFICGGEKLPYQLFHRYREQFQIDIHEGYGLTEASPVCTWHYANDKIKPESVGRSFLCCEVLIVNDENKFLGSGDIGEVCIRGQNVMKGYFNNTIATTKILRNGLLHTEDIGYIDKEGYLFLTGLIKNQINIAGKKIYPLFLKRLICKNEMVLDCTFSFNSKNKIFPSIKALITLKNKNDNTIGLVENWCKENISRNIFYKII